MRPDAARRCSSFRREYKACAEPALLPDAACCPGKSLSIELDVPRIGVGRDDDDDDAFLEEVRFRAAVAQLMGAKDVSRFAVTRIAATPMSPMNRRVIGDNM
jgi:hypothetical protein